MIIFIGTTLFHVVTDRRHTAGALKIKNKISVSLYVMYIRFESE